MFPANRCRPGRAETPSASPADVGGVAQTPGGPGDTTKAPQGEAGPSETFRMRGGTPTVRRVGVNGGE